MQDIVILCSAPADIKYALAIREQHAEDRCRIFAIQLEDMALFLRSLPLPDRTKIELIDYPAARFSAVRFWRNVRIRRHLDAIKRRHFAETTGSAVYFFAPYVDWVAFAILSTLKARNRLVHVAYLPAADAERAKASFGQRVVLLWMRWATRTRLEYGRYNARVVPTWPDMADVETVEAQDVRPVLAKYVVRVVDASSGGRNILLFPGCETLTTNLRPVTEELVRRLGEQGARVFVKPHPRLGSPDWMRGLGVVEVPKSVPAEFIDLTSFSGVVGCESLALALAARMTDAPCVSLVNMLHYRIASRPGLYREYIGKHSDGRAVFPDTVDDALRLLSGGRA